MTNRQTTDDDGGGAVLVAGHREGTVAADPSPGRGDAYHYGRETRARMTSTWDEAAVELERGWEQAGRPSGLSWADARGAVREGWDRVEKSSAGEDAATSEGMPERKQGPIVAGRAIPG